MEHIYLKKDGPAKECLLDLKKNLLRNNACYVILTCSRPAANGKMNVELSYEGDEALAAYLVDNAQTFFESTQIN